jgi:hypothetical protein
VGRVWRKEEVVTVHGSQTDRGLAKSNDFVSLSTSVGRVVGVVVRWFSKAAGAGANNAA